MTNQEQLKNKIMTYEQGYIESSIRWKLELGDEIFKKIDIKRAIAWLKSEVKNKSDENISIPLKELNVLIDKAFNDITIRKINEKI